MAKKSPSLSSSVESGDSGSGSRRQVVRYPKDGYFAIVNPKGLCPSLRSANRCFDKNTLLDVSGQMTTIDMPVKSTGKDSEKKSSPREISEISKQSQFLTMISLQQDFPVRVFPLLDGVRVSQTRQGELFSGKFSECLEIKDQAIYSLRMLKDYFHMSGVEPSQSYCFRWMNLGMMLCGRSLTLNIGCHKTGKGSLSLVLEKTVDKRYYLSKNILKKILEKKDAHPDIQWKSGIKGEGVVPFPDKINKPSRAITPAEGGANRMTHGILIDRGKLRKKGISTALDSNYSKGISVDNHAQRINILKGSRIRRLTPKECERLQGFPDDWTEGVSDTQRYKQMGNAVSVPVIEAIGKRLLKIL